VGTIASGAHIGILLSRMVIGIVADLFGWRAVYAVAALGAWVFALVLWRVLPTLPPRARMSYGDRGVSVPATGAVLTLGMASLGVAAAGQRSIVVLLVAIVACDVAVQASLVLNQTRLLSLESSMRSRMNTPSVTCNFIGGALGSALAGVLWHVGGWSAVLLGGTTVLALALVLWLLGRRVLVLATGR
jgi:predicted MFS family arabinose efflux permease